MTIYVHAYPFIPDDPERNTRAITALCRDRDLVDGDVILLPFQAMTGTVEDYWTTREENRQRNAHWLKKLSAAIARTPVRVIVPVVLPEGLGVIELFRGAVKSLNFEWIKGGVAVKASDCALDYDLNFRSAAVGETFEPTDSSNLLVIDGQGFTDGRVWLGQCKVVKSGRTRANYMAYPHAFTPEDGKVVWLDANHERFAAMQQALRLYMKQCGFEKISLGLSGGLDSAVVACLATSVVGAQNVNAYIMPSRFTSEESFKDARDLAKNLGLKLREMPIMPSVEVLAETAGKWVPYWADQGLMRENLQARARGTLLMSVSNADGSLVLNTGNKSELAVGYCTLYGDMVGGLAPLSDVYKSDLYEMCRAVDYLRQMIPANILKKAPTAELRENQKDEDSLPPYEVLDGVLKDMLEGHADGKKLRKKYGSELAVSITKLVMRARFKHIQAPLGVKLSPCPLKGLPEAFFTGLLPKQL